MGIEMALEDFDRRLKRLDVATKRTATALITIVKQVAEQNHETTKFVETVPESAALRQKLVDIDQSIVGIRRRLDEAQRQVDQA